MSKRTETEMLEISPFDGDCGELIGRHPDQVTLDAWRTRPVAFGMKAIRAKCMDCAENWNEVRKCVCVDCPLWPLRMGQNPKAIRDARKSGTFAD